MESRRDYRKLMNIKKRNKNYAKGIVLATLGLGIGLANSTTTHAESREWKANTSTTIKKGDTEYKILWGDTLSLISRDSGITMDTLAKLNNILNQDLIYEGNVLVFGNGATATVKDSSGNVIAETALTEQDKAGIKEAQKNNTTTNNTNSTVNNSSSSKSSGTTTNTNNSKGNNSPSSNGNNVINTVKPVKPTTGGNGGTTNPTNPVKPPVVDPTNPVKPQEKEYVITINHVSTDGEVLSKETRKAKENTTVEAKALDFTDRNYELIGESTQTVNVKEDTIITFIYKKIDDTKPEVEKVNIKVEHIADDGKVLSTETIKAEKDSIVKADAKDFTEQGYVLNDEISKSVKAVEGATITFNYRKVDVPNPIENFKVITQYVDENGEILADPRVSDKVEKGTLYKAEAIDINGYTVKGESTQTVLVNSDTTIKFVYTKDETPTTPTNEDRFETVNIDVNGKDLGQNVDTTKFDKVSEDTKQTVETLENGNTITTHTTTIVWKAKDVYVPKHTESNETRVYDENQTYLGATVPNGYTEISRSQGKDEVTTAENGDTHTIHVTNVTVKKNYVPVHTESNETRVYDENQTYLGATVPNGYTEISRSQGKDEVTTQPNGDTHTIHVTNVIAKKELQGYGELADKKFNSRMEAHNWAMDNYPEWANRYAVSETETGSGIWEVYFMGWK